MYAMGFTLNVLTLLGMVLAIGLVVDDAIVVLENIYRRIEHGQPSLLAAIDGSKEIGFAVIATTLVLSAVFVPISFLERPRGAALQRVRVHARGVDPVLVHRGPHAHADDDLAALPGRGDPQSDQRSGGGSIHQPVGVVRALAAPDASALLDRGDLRAGGPGRRARAGLHVPERKHAQR